MGYNAETKVTRLYAGEENLIPEVWEKNSCQTN